MRTALSYFFMGVFILVIVKLFRKFYEIICTHIEWREKMRVCDKNLDKAVKALTSEERAEER